MLARSLFTAILLILAIMLTALANATAYAQSNEPICGSVEAFNCTQKRDYSDGLGPVTLFGRAKDAFKGFFESWEKGDIDTAKTYIGGAIGYMNGADAAWASDPQLAAASPAYDEMMRKVKQYDEWLPYVEDLAQEYFNAATWIEEARQGKEGAAEVAKINALDLQKSMDKAVAANVPESFIVPGIGEVKSATIADVWEGPRPDEAAFDNLVPYPTAGDGQAPMAGDYVLVKPTGGSWDYAQVSGVSGSDIEVKGPEGKTRSVKPGEFVIIK